MRVKCEYFTSGELSLEHLPYRAIAEFDRKGKISLLSKCPHSGLFTAGHSTLKHQFLGATTDSREKCLNQNALTDLAVTYFGGV
jgi:hypothetical protein